MNPSIGSHSFMNCSILPDENVRVRYWHEQMREYGGPYLATALIGNKSDVLEKDVIFPEG